MTASTTIVIFGASGDLSKRKSLVLPGDATALFLGNPGFTENSRPLGRRSWLATGDH